MLTPTIEKIIFLSSAINQTVVPSTLSVHFLFFGAVRTGVLEDPDKMDALIARQAELQDRLDAADAWNIDSKPGNTCRG